MKFIAITLIGTILAGCGGFSPPKPIPIRDQVFVSIELVDRFDNPRQLGNADCTNGICYIKILKGRYPDCITHEVRHAFEGPWHGNNPSSEDCFY